MTITKVVTYITVTAALGSLSVAGQAVISAKAGVVHYTEGEVFVVTGAESKPVEMKTGGRYTELKDGQELTTTEGRVEVLLNPGVFLRMGENSTVKMISTRLADTRLELTKGVALVEVAELSKENAVTMLVKDVAVTFTKTCLVRMDVETGLRVYNGEVQVMAGGTPQTLKDGREMQFAANNAVVKFDTKVGDPLYRWANRRAEYLAMANVASAHAARQNGMVSSYSTGGWYYNPFYGMMTYLPGGNGMYRSPFGYFYYSPNRVRGYYQSYARPESPSMAGGGYGGGAPQRTWNADYGYSTVGSRSAAPVSMPPSGGGGGAPAAAAPVSSGGGRGGDAGTSRGGGSGSSGR